MQLSHLLRLTDRSVHTFPQSILKVINVKRCCTLAWMGILAARIFFLTPLVVYTIHFQWQDEEFMVKWDVERQLLHYISVGGRAVMFVWAQRCCHAVTHVDRRSQERTMKDEGKKSLRKTSWNPDCPQLLHLKSPHYQIIMASEIHRQQPLNRVLCEVSGFSSASPSFMLAVRLFPADTSLVVASWRGLVQILCIHFISIYISAQ